MIDSDYADASSTLEPQPKAGFLSQWKEDVNCVFERDPAARNIFEVIVTYPGIQAIFMHRVSHKLWRKQWFFLARLIAFFSRLITNVDIHPGAQIGRRFFIDHGAGVVIGETAIVGDDVTLYHGVTLGGTSWNKGRRHPFVGDGTLVGAGAKILGAISIGAGVRVGANSVVVEDVPAGATVVGIPGKIVTSHRSSASQKYGINLDHHLIPDPVGKAIACLLSRMDVLEQHIQVANISGNHGQKAKYENCDIDNEICEKDCVGSSSENFGANASDVLAAREKIAAGQN